MSFRWKLGSWVNRMAVKIAGIAPRDPSSLAMWGSPLDNLAGVDVTENTAFNSSVIWAATNIISSCMATMPCCLMERRDGGSFDVDEGTHVDMITVAPNPEMTWPVFVETLQAHILVWGNGYAEIEFDKQGRPIALWPLLPSKVTPARDGKGALVYVVENPDDYSRPIVLDAARVLHIPGLSFDGLVGYNVIRVARQSIGLTMAAEHYGAAFFGNGTVPSGVLTTDKKYSQEAVENIRESWNRDHQGVSKAHRIGVLMDGFTWQQMTVNPEHAQLLATRKFQVEEVCRWFNVAPHLLRHLERSTNNNIEQQSLEHVVYTMNPWRMKWQGELNKKLLKPEQRRRFFHRFDMSELQKGTWLEHVKGLAVCRQAGIYSVDDCRKRLGDNPLPDGLGSIYLQAVNYVNVENADEIGSTMPGKPGTPGE